MTEYLKEYLLSEITPNTFLRYTKAREKLVTTGHINTPLLGVLTRKAPTGRIGNKQYVFICGKKYTESMLHKLYSGVEIVCEFSIPYCKKLLRNMKHQYPTSFVFPFTETHGKNQGCIFGYLVSCTDNSLVDVGLEASYFFTNKNTLDFFSNNTAELPEKNIQKIKKMLSTVSGDCQSCIVGSAAIQLFNKNTCSTFLTTEVWTRKNNKIDLILEKINTTRIIKIINKKVEWFKKYYFIPSHDITVKCGNEVTMSNFFEREEIFCYYKGVKFLYAGGDNSTSSINVITPLTVKSKYSCNYKSNYKPSKKNRVNTVWDPVKEYTVDIHTHHTLEGLKGMSKGYWILTMDGTFTVIRAEEMYIPWLASGFIATGVLEQQHQVLVMYPANKFSAKWSTADYIISHLLSLDITNIKLSGFEQQPISKPISKPIRKKKRNTVKKPKMKNNTVRLIKKKNTIIQNEQKRDCLPAFFTLLPGNH